MKTERWHPGDAQSALKSNASSQRTMRPLDGEGKCAVHTRVEVSQKRPNSLRDDMSTNLATRT